MAQRDPADAAAGGSSSNSDKLQAGPSLLLEEIATTDDCMSNGDEDSDSHSIHSRRDSLDPGKAPDQMAGLANGSPPGEKNSRTDSSGHLGNSSGESGQKRNLAEDERGHGATLRKACDLCTKRKRKCNGQHPCSQCLETGASSQCVYSPRLKSGRKKKVRVEGGLYDDGVGAVDGAGMVLANHRRSASGNVHSVDSAAGRFSLSGAVGLAGHIENYFLATYLRDFNRIVPLTTESSVTEGMLEVLSPTVSSRGLSQASPIPQPESRRQAKLAVFWGVVAMGSRILKAHDEATARYLSQMRASLRECFDSNDREVVQAYLLLSTVETMRGHEDAGKRYLDHAHTMHTGNAMGPEGRLREGRHEQEESLDLVFQIYGQPDGSVGHFSTAPGSVMGAHGLDGRESGGGFAWDGEHPGSGRRHGCSADAVSQMIAQAMSPPTESQSGPLKALKYLSTACGLSSEVFDASNKCVTVKQYLGEMDAALQGAGSLFKHTDLSECITGVVMVKIWGGVTVLMRSWGKPEDKEMGLFQVEEGVGYALTRPGLMTFPMWWHALHSAAVVLAHFGRNDTYTRLRETFNKNTFPGTEMPSIESYSPGAICPQLGGSCSKLAYWLQVRGTMCSVPGWSPQFSEKLSEASESAAYAAVLSRNMVACMSEKNKDKSIPVVPGGGTAIIGLVDREAPSENELRTTLSPGLSDLPDVGGIDDLGGGEDLDSLGVEFDLSHLKEFEAEVDTAKGGAPSVGGEVHLDAAAAAIAIATATAAAEAADADADADASATVDAAVDGNTASGGPIDGDGGVASQGVEELSRQISFSIGGIGISRQNSATGGEFLSHQSSFDMSTMMQMTFSDEELKQQEGGIDAMEMALAFGDGPAKELFGVELSGL